MQENYEALDALLGPEPSVEEDHQEPAEKPAAEDPEEPSVSEDVENTDPEESEESESDEEEQPEGTPKHIPFERFQKVVQDRNADRERYETAIKEYDGLLSDRGFLVHRLQQLDARAQTPTSTDAPPAEVPDAPFYPNTQRGHERMEADQTKATEILPETLTDPALRRAVLGQVRDGLSYVEAAREVIRLMGKNADTYRREGGANKEAEVAKKTRMSATERPRAGEPSKQDRLRRDLQSKSESVRMAAAAEYLDL